MVCVWICGGGVCDLWDGYVLSSFCHAAGFGMGGSCGLDQHGRVGLLSFVGRIYKFQSGVLASELAQIVWTALTRVQARSYP